jgi:hypothetical protein
MTQKTNQPSLKVAFHLSIPGFRLRFIGEWFRKVTNW